MNNTLKTILKASGFAIIGLIVLWLVYRSNNIAYQAECLQKNISIADCNLIDKVVSDIKSAKYIWVFISLILFTISNISRALRWQLMLEPLGYIPKFFNSFAAILVAYLSNLGLPRSGEFVRAGILSKYEQYPADKVMGTIILDRIVDVVCLLLVVLLTIALSFENFYGYLSTNLDFSSKVSSINSGILATVIIGLITLVLILIKNKSILIKSKIGSKVFNLLIGLKDGILSITKLRRPYLFLFHTVVIWFCYFAMTYVVFFAFEPTSHLGPIAGLVIFVFGTLGIVFPSPGGMGSYHFLVGEGLGLYGIESGDAFSFANIIFFSIQLLVNVVLGLIALIFLPIYNRKT